MDINKLLKERNIKYRKIIIIVFFIIFLVLLTTFSVNTSLSNKENTIKCIIYSIILSFIFSFFIYFIERIMVKTKINKLIQTGEMQSINLELEKITEENYLKKNLIKTENYLIYIGIKLSIIKISEIKRLYMTSYGWRGARGQKTAIVLNNGNQYFVLDNEGKIYKELEKN